MNVIEIKLSRRGPIRKHVDSPVLVCPKCELRVPCTRDDERYYRKTKRWPWCCGVSLEPRRDVGT